MINKRCKSCGLQLPMRSPAVECRQCRYKRGTAEVFARLMDFLARGVEKVFKGVVDAEVKELGRRGAVMVKGALADCLRGR